MTIAANVAPPGYRHGYIMKNQLILGTGIDLVENERMLQILRRWNRRFTDRVFLPGEQSYCDSKGMPHIYYAARFAVKEAVAKAFGTGIGPRLGWLDIEVVKDNESGAPSVRLGSNGEKLTREYGAVSLKISLSHTRRFSVAQALLLGENS